MDYNVDSLNYIKQLHNLDKVPCNMLLFTIYIKIASFPLIIKYQLTFTITITHTDILQPWDKNEKSVILIFFFCSLDHAFS
jgi:hypothetical protein